MREVRVLRNRLKRFGATLLEPEIECVRVTVLPQGRMTRKDAAAYLGRESQTLAVWQSKGIGPRSQSIMGRVYYDVAELERWIASGGDSAPAPGVVA